MSVVASRNVGPEQLLHQIAEVAVAETHEDLALYVHIPFCSSKCHFCDWVTDIPVARLRSGRPERVGYIDALCAQIRFYGPQLTRIGYQAGVMYWGGGTPTRLAPDEMRLVRAALEEAFDLGGIRQWTVESTPNDLDPSRLETLRELGADRVSVGLQSLSAEQLRRAGRAHSREQSIEAISMLRAAGFDNFNLDVISSFPGEDEASFRNTLAELLEFDPPHISIYPYRATPKTLMAMQIDREFVAAHRQVEMIETYEMAMEMMTSAGYVEYCHGYWVRDAAHEDLDGNFKYDLAGDKIGFGSGAESIIGHHLLWNENARYDDFLRDPLSFTLTHRFTLDEPKRLTASIGGALMTREGLDFDRFRRLTGLSFPEVRATDYFARWFDTLEECGAQFIETSRSLRIRPDVIHRVYITHLARSVAPGLEPARA